MDQYRAGTRYSFHESIMRGKFEGEFLQTEFCAPEKPDTVQFFKKGMVIHVINISNVSLSFGGANLFSNVNLLFTPWKLLWDHRSKRSGQVNFFTDPFRRA